MLEEDDYRYIRTGWFDQGRSCDVLVQIAVAMLPGKRMPVRWKAGENFEHLYGDGVHWSQTASYHLLLISGVPILRIWTNAKCKTLVEPSSLLMKHMKKEGFVSEPIPNGTKRKRKEFSDRVSVTMSEEIVLILELVKGIYGVGNT